MPNPGYRFLPSPSANYIELHFTIEIGRCRRKLYLGLLRTVLFYDVLQRSTVRNRPRRRPRPLSLEAGVGASKMERIPYILGTALQITAHHVRYVTRIDRFQPVAAQDIFSIVRVGRYLSVSEDRGVLLLSAEESSVRVTSFCARQSKVIEVFRVLVKRLNS